MAVQCRINGDEASITVDGRFQFDVHQAFREAMLQAVNAAGVAAIDVNLFETDYIDSSALGMLLVLREQASEKHITKLSITGARASVRQVLVIAKFDKFFTMQ